MKKYGFTPLVFALVFFAQPLTANDGRQAIYDYIEIYKDIAISEMERTGIPASIKMAQAILESNAGRSQLALRANNHFGIKCGNDWNGRTFYQKDDDRDSRGRLIKSCFRSYTNAEESFIAHSEFLSGPSRSSRYGWLFELDPKDYKAWAHGLQRSGYATNRRYGQLLINVIENYRLYELDQVSTPLAGRTENTRGRTNESRTSADNRFFKSAPPLRARREVEINQLRVVRANAGETLADLALELDIPLRALLRFNDGVEDGFEPFDRDRNVFLQPKRRNYRGGRDRHRVQEGQEMLDIALQYGIRLDVLYRKNRMDEDRQPAVGETIYIRGRRNRNQTVRYRPANYRPAQETPPQEKLPEIQPEAPQSEPDIIAESNNNEGSVAGYSTSDDVPVDTGMGMNSVNAAESAISATTRTDTVPQNIESTSAGEHIVSPGETLFAISRKYGLSVDELMRKNGLSDTALRIGQVLIVR